MKTTLHFKWLLLLTSLCTGYAMASSKTPATAPSTSTISLAARPYVQLKHPDWAKDAVIYQINTRQFSQEGTFNAAAKQLPRLKKLGVDILWLMPVQPIGEKNRKGSLGSPYSVKDYLAVNPEFGTKEDLKAFIARAHQLGMYVILDWVANHTAWDNHLVTSHPQWYARDWKGDFRPTPWWDWHDIIELDYSQPELRRYMIDAMKYWVKDIGFDGFRADVAGFVPLDFWEQLRPELDAIKPVFMLAEWETRDLHAKAFDATYGWSWYEAAHQIAQGHADVNKLYVYYSWNERHYPQDIFRMLGVSNHDVNAWEQTEFKAFGAALHAFMALSVVGEGIPMIYNGQEAGNQKQLAFFERDPIEWREHENGALYQKLFALKKANSALWNAAWGARMIPVFNSAPNQVLSFVRQNDNNKVFAVFNLSKQPQQVSFKEKLHHGSYQDFHSGNQINIKADTSLELAPWSYRIMTVQL
ncbi:alpha-amylase family glycosyl hydrolase [Rheinheimera sp. 4Y26]|uniref:alpha-amylase family glycosyl hydrolase n=1 Tax=Rheinheimera sp. 4Y26 TaxID=2977811 RepID=UPI0021B0C689|nr:alpha-amylase family glycosyl hydrolase [Rheinheimera sp. 4Y26]MCT6700294.1 alpha-amylase family glycosyl hydrolase [Rheinheimera sp. 4Y26]